MFFVQSFQYVCIHVIPDQLMTFAGTSDPCAIGEQKFIFNKLVRLCFFDRKYFSATGILEKIVLLQSGNLTSIGKIGLEENKEYTKVLMAKLTETLKIPADRSVFFCFNFLTPETSSKVVARIKPVKLQLRRFLLFSDRFVATLPPDFRNHEQTHIVSVKKAF